MQNCLVMGRYPIFGDVSAPKAPGSKSRGVGLGPHHFEMPSTPLTKLRHQKTCRFTVHRESFGKMKETV